MNKLHDDGYIAIYLNEEDNLLYYKIISYPKFSKIIRYSHNKIFEIVTKRKQSSTVLNMVADLLDAKILLTEDIRFIAEVSYRRLAKAGVENLAILLPEGIHVRINVEKTLEYMGSDIFKNVALFPSDGVARTWLRNLNQ